MTGILEAIGGSGFSMLGLHCWLAWWACSTCASLASRASRSVSLSHRCAIYCRGRPGFVLCVASGLVFVTGLMNNVTLHPYVALQIDLYLQIKLLFILLAGVNLLAFYLTGVSRVVDGLGPGDDAPALAKAIGGISLFLWLWPPLPGY